MGQNVRKRTASETLNETDISTKYSKLEEENIKLKNMITSLKDDYEKQLANQANMFRALIEKEKDALKQKLLVEQNKSSILKKGKERMKTKLEDIMEESQKLKKLNLKKLKNSKQ